jgi:PAS domain S-box-containing protein
LDVTPPLWRHPLALLAYALLAASLLLLSWWRWRARRRRERGYFEQIRDREERLKLALWASGDQFWDYDLRNNVLMRLRAHDDVRSASDLRVESLFDQDHQIHPDDLPQVQERLRQHLRSETGLFLSEHRVLEHGQWVWVRARGKVVERDADGRPVRLAGTARNVTNSRHAERERRIAAEVLRSMTEAVSVLDREFDFVSVNPAFSRMTGYGDVEVIGRNGSLLDSAQHDPAFYLQVREHLERHGRWSGEMWQQRKDGEEFLCAYECTAVLDHNGQHQLYVAVLSDITDQKRAEQELRYLANYDTLTNLPNRTLLAERLSRAIVRAGRNRASACCSSTSTASRTSTIRSATPPATASCARRRCACRKPWARNTPSRAWVATSSPWCWRTWLRRKTPTRSRARSSWRSRRRFSPTIATKCRFRHRSASASIPTMRRCRPNCSSRPTPRCTRPSRSVAAPSCGIPRRWTC